MHLHLNEEGGILAWPRLCESVGLSMAWAHRSWPQTQPGEQWGFPQPTSDLAGEMKVFPAQEKEFCVGALQVNQHLSASKLFEGNVGKPPTPSTSWPGIKSAGLLLQPGLGQGWACRWVSRKPCGDREGRNILHS